MPEVPSLPPVEPPAPEAPQPFIGRRTLLGAAAAVLGISAGAVCGVKISSKENHPAPGPDAAAPEAPAATVSPDEGETTNYKAAAEAVKNLDEWASVDTDGCTVYLSIDQEGAPSWHAGALRSRRTEHGYANNFTILRFGKRQDPNNPDGASLNKYFGELRDSAGITGKDWGRVAVAPNFTQHGGAAAHYAHAVNRTVYALHRYTPDAKASVLINVANGESEKIVAALKNSDGERLNTGALESVGVEGFSNGKAIPFDAEGNADVSGFLDSKRILEVAEATGIKKVWISTGIPLTDRALDTPGYTNTQREKIAEAMAGVVEELMKNGLEVVGFSLLAANQLVSNGRDFSFPPDSVGSYQLLHDKLAQLDSNLALSVLATPAQITG